MTIGEFSLHNPFNMRLYQKQIEIEREQKSNMSLVFTFQKFMISSCFIYV